MSASSGKGKGNEMKVVVYSYQEGDRLRFLYVDENFANSRFPDTVKKIVTHRKPRVCREPIRLTYKEVLFFKKNGYLLVPDVIFKECEGVC